MKDKIISLTESQADRIIEMAWEDRTPFEAIESQFGLKEKEVIVLMRSNMKRSSFLLWRKRMTGRHTKHKNLRSQAVARFKCTRQRAISHNKISKR
ncbi:MAG: TIGR03643 family protein [Chitinophagaceae bacterium]|nr:TIGR03643 family protein [Chitinophagaceae bacterium]